MPLMFTAHMPEVALSGTPVAASIGTLEYIAPSSNVSILYVPTALNALLSAPMSWLSHETDVPAAAS